MGFVVKVEPALKKVWIIYFFLSIMTIGPFAGYAISLPLYILSRVFRPARPVADKVLQLSVAFLMKVQPWYNGEISIRLPRRPHPRGLLIVGNHRSHLDAFILLSQIPGIRLMAKRSLFYNPVLGPMLWAMGCIPVDLGLDQFWRAMKKVRACLAENEIVFIFPELTRCAPGFQGVNSFASAPFLAAIQQMAPILPISIQGTDRVWPKGELSINAGHPIVVKSLPLIEHSPTSEALALKKRAASLIQAELAL